MQARLDATRTSSRKSKKEGAQKKMNDDMDDEHNGLPDASTGGMRWPSLGDLTSGATARSLFDAGKRAGSATVKGGAGTLGAMGGAACGLGFGVLNAPDGALRGALLSGYGNPPQDERMAVTHARAAGLFGAGLVVVPVVTAYGFGVEGWEAGVSFAESNLLPSPSPSDAGTMVQGGGSEGGSNSEGEGEGETSDTVE